MGRAAKKEEDSTIKKGPENRVFQAAARLKKLQSEGAGAAWAAVSVVDDESAGAA